MKAWKGLDSGGSSPSGGTLNCAMHHYITDTCHRNSLSKSQMRDESSLRGSPNTWCKCGARGRMFAVCQCVRVLKTSGCVQRGDVCFSMRCACASSFSSCSAWPKCWPETFKSTHFLFYFLLHLICFATCAVSTQILEASCRAASLKCK